MNKHMRAKVSHFITELCSAATRLEGHEQEIISQPRNAAMHVSDAGGATSIWLTPIARNAGQRSLMYERTSDIGLGKQPVPLAMRLNWHSVYTFPPLPRRAEKDPLRLFIFGFMIDEDGRECDAKRYITGNPFILRNFVARLIKLRVTRIYLADANQRVIFGLHKHGCYRIEFNADGIIISVRDVRVGERNTYVCPASRLMTNTDCLHMLDCAEEPV